MNLKKKTKVKPENILLSHDQSCVKRPVVCHLADFGAFNICVHVSMRQLSLCVYRYGVVTISRLLKIIGLFCKICSLL